MRRLCVRMAAMVGAGLSLAGCAGLPPTRHLVCAQSDRPLIDAAIHGQQAAYLDVLTYNLEGLQWPARSGRSKNLAAIAEHLNGLREAGQAPDIVLFQEVFSPAAVRSVVNTGYPAMVSGPSRTADGLRNDGIDLPGQGRPWKGELGVKIAGSGLVILSRYPIVARAALPYSSRACAGFDCLSNKGMVMATIVMPGVPQPIDIVNTHMNSKRSSKVKPARHHAAHRAQGAELRAFLEDRHDDGRPIILGGDFNMKNSPERFRAFRGNHGFELVHEYCRADMRCDVRLSWDGDEPWMNAQDLQFFGSGVTARVEPVRVEAMFDGSPGNPRLSDHDGFRVRYRISWNPASTLSAVCDAPPPARAS